MEKVTGIAHDDVIRVLLDDYATAGGTCEEVAVAGSGHVPFMSHPVEFDLAFHRHLELADSGRPETPCTDC